ncbi:prolyl 4-Hydroxylase alpha-subunit, region [Onchocerca flexuosa]|uniref:Prolyl 4-Hydroxylase alpha-subunit, region n=1 Tax=Onchocerca flexuosa TaxID=387005 RepID=A0A238BK71_9BILA|nr:prolyl 4-Hydroxylase alpha-subunit, region [Onchocerca flexuosa]
MKLSLLKEKIVVLSISAELYSSIASLKAIIGAKNDIPVIINSYVVKELQKLDYLKKLLQKVEEHNDKVIRDGEETIRHPFNAFLLINGMITDWNKVIKIMRSNSADDIIRNMTRLRDIRHTYYPTEVLLFALACLKSIKPSFTFEREYREMKSKNTFNPDHPRAKDNVKEYEYLLKNNGVQHIDMRRDIPQLNNIRNKSCFDEGVWLTYEALCRQEASVNTKAQSQLYCYYKMDRPYLRLAAFKIEIVHQNPLIVLFYNVVSDHEARIMQMLAVPKACSVLLASYYSFACSFSRSMERKRIILFALNCQNDITVFQLIGSKIYNILTGNLEYSFHAIKSASLRPMEHEVVKRVDKRLELATNLETETAEDLSVRNYGIGGQFEPHLDCALLISNGDHSFKKLGTGNRVATLLIYMTEPEIGGRTVFVSNLKISVPCTRKG